MAVGTNNKEDAYVLVKQISLDGATVSSNGEADDEWVQGDVPILGRSGFILFFLAGGFGGAVGLFVVSKQMMLKTAGKSMRTLIGDEGMKKAASVKTDAKAAKKAGMESPEERQRRINKERQKEEKMQKAPPKKLPKAMTSVLVGLISTASSRPPQAVQVRLRQPEGRVQWWLPKRPRKWTE